MLTCKDLIQKRKEMWDKDPEKDEELLRSFLEYITRNPDSEINKELMETPEYLIEMFFKIVNKEGQTVPFFLNDVQREFESILKAQEKEYLEGKRLFLNYMLLKGRQQGLTSYITAKQLARAISGKNFSGYILADNAENTEDIFEDKVRFTYDELPDALKPEEKLNNARALLFKNLRSKIRVATAGKKGAGRSKTINFLHISEAAFVDSLDSLLLGIRPAITKGAMVLLESTANGFNEFRDLWYSDNNYTKLFFQWWKTSEYTMSFESEEHKKAFFDDIENRSEWVYERLRWLRKEENLADGQLYWYYKQYLDFGEGIKQEYPCTVDEAFLASGRCVFEQEKLILRKMVLEKQYKKNPPKRGYFNIRWRDETLLNVIDGFEWVDDSNGFITIYEESKPLYPYVLGGDTKGEGKDFFAATVKENNSGKRVCTMHSSLIDSNTFTHQAYCLGMYFNQALITIEVNFNTYPLEELQRLKYQNMYVRKKYDDYTGTYLNKYGFKTDGTTRPLMIAKEQILIKNHIDLFTDIRFIDECLTFIDKQGRYDAENGKHDDILFSDMIAEMGSEQQRRYVLEVSEVKKPKLIEKLGLAKPSVKAGKWR